MMTREIQNEWCQWMNNTYILEPVDPEGRWSRVHQTVEVNVTSFVDAVLVEGFAQPQFHDWSVWKATSYAFNFGDGKEKKHIIDETYLKNIINPMKQMDQKLKGDLLAMCNLYDYRPYFVNLNKWISLTFTCRKENLFYLFGAAKLDSIVCSIWRPNYSELCW